MSAYAVTVENATGLRYGPGPLAAVTSWTRTRRLDRGGDIAFTTPATDERTSLLRNRRYARCHSTIDGVRAEVGLGIIDSIGLDTEGRGLSVSGGDLLRELAMRSVGPTALSGKGLPLIGEADAGETPISLTKALDIILERCNGNSVTLEDWDIDYTTYGSTGDTTNGIDLISNVTNIANWVGREGGPIYGAGIPAGVTVTVVGADSIEFSGMATADATGVSIYRSQVYHEFNGESILQSLIKVAELTGTHFRLGTGRQIVWLYNVQPSSGIRAVVGADPVAAESNPDICLITDLEYIKDSSELISRVHPYGGGSGDVRLDLIGTTRTAPDGYVLNANPADPNVQNFLERTAAEADYGFNVEYHTFSDIAPTVDPGDATYAAALAAAKNTLFDATLEYLRTHSYLQESYRLTVTKLDQEILPGQTIRVIYKAFVDGYQWVDIDADLLVLEATTELDDAGTRTPSLVVSTVPRWPVNDVEIVVGLARAVQQAQSHPQTTTHAATATTATTAGSITNPIIARFTHTTGQSIPNSADTVVNYETSVHDTHSRVTVGAAWHFTAAVAGYYHVEASALFVTSTAWAIGERAHLYLFKNGAFYSGLDRTDNHTTTTHQVRVAGSDVVYLAAEDTISIAINQNSGGALALSASGNNNYVSIFKIG